MEFEMTKRHVARGARADAEAGNRIYLIKNASELGATYQIRVLLYRAIQEEKKLVLDIPQACELRDNLKELIKEHRRNFEITRS